MFVYNLKPLFSSLNDVISLDSHMWCEKILMASISHLEAKDHLERIYMVVQGLVHGP
jgi:hypothetical protein